MNSEFYSKHFNLEKVGQGIYAAIANEGGGSVANAGFIDLGDKTIVFDTFNTPQAAEDLKRFAEKETNRPVTWVVNSHFHGDHIRGNQVFNDSIIVSSRLTYERIRDIHPARIEQQKKGVEELSNYIDTLKKQFNLKKDRELEIKINFLSEIETSLPSLNLTLPHQTFSQETMFNGSKRSAKLFTLGGGHSYCDALLFIEEEKVIFMGDLLFVNSHPTFFEESNPMLWTGILKKVEGLDFNVAVPGHGPVGSKKDLMEIIHYIDEISRLTASSDILEEIKLPEKYQGWPSPEIFHQNLQRLKVILTK